MFDYIRKLYVELPESLMRGYKQGHFSFNVPGGRCEACEGNGAKRLDMDFLSDVWVVCDSCGGTRYCSDTLEVRYRGKTIAECLDMSTDEALEHFAKVPKLKRLLKVMSDIGLGYLKLGQPASTLSAGEAQRVKLARELARPATERTLYILDEPTVGLHMSDVVLLLRLLQKLVDRGSTVICIEHKMDLLKSADYLIDLGPEGGDAGGTLVAAGTPEEVAMCTRSYTGRILAERLRQSSRGLRKDIDRLAKEVIKRRLADDRVTAR